MKAFAEPLPAVRFGEEQEAGGVRHPQRTHPRRTRWLREVFSRCVCGVLPFGIILNLVVRSVEVVVLPAGEFVRPVGGVL